MPQPRQDQSDYLAHFTKGPNAYQNLISILSERVIHAGTLPWVNRPAVCLTECPWPSLMQHAAQYSPYGIGFNKPFVFAAGGGPVYYVRADHFNKQEWMDHVKTFVAPFWPPYRPKKLRGADWMGGKTVDYSHEREWRVPHDLAFQPDDVEFIVLKSYEDMAKFPKELKDAIGREKFILMDIYRNIETLWPTHKL